VIGDFQEPYGAVLAEVVDMASISNEVIGQPMEDHPCER
jgi:hypothetical protein